jgi:hypothetical protein
MKNGKNPKQIIAFLYNNIVNKVQCKESNFFQYYKSFNVQEILVKVLTLKSRKLSSKHIRTHTGAAQL